MEEIPRERKSQMSLAVIYLKEGVAKEQKGQLIARTKTPETTGICVPSFRKCKNAGVPGSQKSV